MKKELIELMDNIQEIQTKNYLELKEELTFQIAEANYLPSRTSKTNLHKAIAQLNLVSYANFKEKDLENNKKKKLLIKNDSNLLLMSNKRNKTVD